MPDFGGFFTAFQAARDAGKGKKGGGGDDGSPQTGDPGLPDPGGYYEEPNALGRMLGMQNTWHSTTGGQDLYGDEAQAEASKWLDDVDDPGGGQNPQSPPQQGNVWGGGRGFGK